MAEETLYDSEAMRRFAGIEPGDDRIPDGPQGPWPQWGRVRPQDAILNFRHLLERHGLTEAIFADVNAHPANKGITLRSAFNPWLEDQFRKRQADAGLAAAGDVRDGRPAYRRQKRFADGGDWL